jgi:CheY-like chemotaxis protein
MDTERTKSFRILVVDDEPYVCEAIKMVLELEGHEVATTDNGNAALTLHSKGPFDLVVTDYSMPGMKGDELAAALRARNPDQRILMVTAYVERLTSEGTPLQHVDDLVAKPFRLEDIRDAVRRVMRRNAAV